MRVELSETNEGKSGIEMRKLSDKQIGILLKIKLLRKLAGDELNLPPAVIGDINNAMNNFDGEPYISLLISTSVNKSLKNLLIEDISCRLYMEQIVNYKRSYIQSVVNSIIGE